MGGSSFQSSHTSRGEDGGEHRLDGAAQGEIHEYRSSREPSPSATGYLALAVALLAAAILVAAATIGVPGTLLHINGVAAIATSGLAMMLTAGALLALRSALSARRDRI